MFLLLMSSKSPWTYAIVPGTKTACARGWCLIIRQLLQACPAYKIQYQDILPNSKSLSIYKKITMYIDIGVFAERRLLEETLELVELLPSPLHPLRSTWLFQGATAFQRASLKLHQGPKERSYRYLVDWCGRICPNLSDLL